MKIKPCPKCGRESIEALMGCITCRSCNLILNDVNAIGHLWNIMSDYMQKERENDHFSDASKKLKPVNEACLGKRVIGITNDRQEFNGCLEMIIHHKLPGYLVTEYNFVDGLKFKCAKRCPDVVYGDEDE